VRGGLGGGVLLGRGQQPARRARRRELRRAPADIELVDARTPGVDRAVSRRLIRRPRGPGCSGSADAGRRNRLVERLLSIRETCRLQGRRLHDYLTAAITADLNGQPIPTPLPP
jgi:hypothetical protein